jgi:protein O-mannosyl-transferase
MNKKRRASAQQKPGKKPQIQATDSSLRTSRPWVGQLLRCSLLLLLVYLAYSNSFGSGWVLDNRFIIQLDPRNKEVTAENLKLIWTKDYWWPKADTTAYRPIVSTSYLINWAVLGNGKHSRESDQVVGFHWVNLIAHGINSILGYFLLLYLIRRNWAAFFGAAVFAVHPIATETVTYLVGRADEFATMSFIGCTLLYIRSTKAQGLRRLPWLLGLTALFAFGCLSKEFVWVFPFVPPLFDGIYRWGSEEYQGRRVKGILLDSVWYIVITLPILVLLAFRAAIFRDTPTPPVPFVDNPILMYAWSDANSLSVNIQNWVMARITACNVAAKGLWKLIWPAHLSSDYSYNQIRLFAGELSNTEDIKALLAALFVAGTLALAVWSYKRNKGISFLIVFYWIAYGPTSNFIINARSIMGDRFLYAPLIAFCGLLVLAVEALARRIGATLEFDRESFRRPWPRLLPHVASASILILFGMRTYARNFDWRSNLTIAESELKESPQSFRGYDSLAEAYYELDPVGKIDRLIELSETAVSILDPLPNEQNGSRSYMMLGIYYGLKGERAATRNSEGLLVMNDKTRIWYEKAARVLERGVELDLVTNNTHRASELKRGKTNPPDVGASELYRYLGMVYQRLDMNEKALEAFAYMQHLDPRNPRAYAQIASTHLALGQIEEAAIAFMQCVVLDPERLDAWEWLTKIYSQISHEPVPAVERTNGRPQLREDNKLVQRHLLEAYKGFIRVAQSSGRADMLGEAREMATNHYHFDARQLEAAASEVPLPKPPAPVFHVFGRKLSE